jgi:hypothetical protein
VFRIDLGVLVSRWGDDCKDSVVLHPVAKIRGKVSLIPVGNKAIFWSENLLYFFIYCKFLLVWRVIVRIVIYVICQKYVFPISRTKSVFRNWIKIDRFWRRVCTIREILSFQVKKFEYAGDKRKNLLERHNLDSSRNDTGLPDGLFSNQKYQYG